MLHCTYSGNVIHFDAIRDSNLSHTVKHWYHLKRWGLNLSILLTFFTTKLNLVQENSVRIKVHNYDSIMQSYSYSVLCNVDSHLMDTIIAFHDTSCIYESHFKVDREATPM